MGAGLSTNFDSFMRCILTIAVYSMSLLLLLLLFLAPGEQAFQARYGRAVHAARYSKKGSREADAGLLALDALHKQVMPFVLRRTKQQVLSDLPPKIITDISCELTLFQRQLYEDFASSQALSEVAGVLKGSSAGAAEGSGGAGKGAGGGEKVPGNVLSALMYLRKLCSHPAMALDWQVRGFIRGQGRKNERIS